MPKLQINIITDKKNEFEIEFSDKFFRNAEGENIKILENDGWIRDNKGNLYREVKDKELAEALRAILVRNGVDAYTHEPHHLFPGYRLHISAKDPKKELKKAIKVLDKEWNAMKELLLKKIK